MTTPHLRWTDPQGRECSLLLASDEIVIGRKGDVHILLDNDHISRHHARIVKTGEGYTLVDLGSAHGSFVNDVRVEQPVALRHGDKISLGMDRITLFFFTQEPETSLPNHREDSTSLEASLADLSLRLSPERSELEKISCLLDFQFQWGRMFTSEMAFQHIVESSLKISAAERGFILLKEPNGFQYAVGIDGQGRALPQSYFRTSRSVVDQVMADGKPVFMAEAIHGKFAEQTSIVAMNLRAIACLPLCGITAEGGTPEILGILYLDSTKAMHHLSGLDEKILSKLAMEAGNVLEKVEMIKSFEQRKKFEEELALAEETQKSLLPQTLPQLEKFCLHAFSKPTRYVGGDFYDFLRMDSGELVAVLGDVTGKGMPAALLSAMLLGCLDLQLRRGAEPTDAVSQLNQFLCEKTASNRFATLFLFTLNAQGEGQFISGGHPPAYLFRSANGEIEELASNSLLLGAFSSAAYPASGLQLDPGDVLVVYSDGLTDAENPEGEMFGDGRVKDVIRAASPSGAQSVEQKLLEAIREFTQDKPQTDDITILIVERTAEDTFAGCGNVPS